MYVNLSRHVGHRVVPFGTHSGFCLKGEGLPLRLCRRIWGEGSAPPNNRIEMLGSALGVWALPFRLMGQSCFASSISFCLKQSHTHTCAPAARMTVLNHNLRTNAQV